MKAKRILSLFMVLVLLVCLLPTVYAAAAAEEWSMESEMKDLGFTSDQLVQSYAGLEDPGEYGAVPFSVPKTGHLTNYDAMNFTCNNGVIQGYHIVDEDQEWPWDPMEIIYCLENKKSFPKGEDQGGSGDIPIDGNPSNTGESVWYSLSDDQRYAVALIMLYGAPGNLWDEEWGVNAIGDHNMHNPNIGYRFATQALIWQITAGTRDATPPYEAHSTYWYDISVGQCMSEDGTVDHFVYAYNYILENMRNHNTIPSFTGDFAATAPEILLTGSSTTVTDTNGVLRKFDFTDGNGVTFSKNGSDLTIHVNGSIPTDTMSAVATLPDPEASLYELWFNPSDDSLQTCIRISVPGSDPVPAYFKLKGSTGSLSLVKTTEDGLNPGGWLFGIYSDAACTQLFAGPYTTDSSGNMYVSDLAAGTYWVKEIGHNDPAINALYQCDSTNPQKVTITTGQTATVSFYNKLNLGTCQIIKTATNGGSVSGWHFTVKDSNGNTIGSYVTDSTGIITLDLEPGTYTVTETDGYYKYWVNDAQPTKTAMIAAGQTATVTFTNQWNGQAQIIKTLANPEAGTVEGWSFTIHKITGTTTAYLTTVTTDSTGTIIVDLEPGNYLITEVLEEDSRWVCTSGLAQTVTVTAGQTAEVTFVNALRSGRIEIQKVDTTGQALAGVEFLLEWSQDGENWQPVTFASATVPQIGGSTSAGMTDGKLKTDANGAAAFSGLYPNLQYRLSETATLDGYQLLADYAYVGGLSVEDDFTVALTVVNAPVFELPATGSRSLVLMPIAAALCLAACAGTLQWLSRKKA